MASRVTCHCQCISKFDRVLKRLTAKKSIASFYWTLLFFGANVFDWNFDRSKIKRLSGFDRHFDFGSTS